MVLESGSDLKPGGNHHCCSNVYSTTCANLTLHRRPRLAPRPVPIKISDRWQTTGLPQ